MLTLLFLPAVGLKRTCDLRGYTGDALPLLTGRERSYSYRHIERFLSAVAPAGGAETLTDALAKWTATLWQPKPQSVDQLPPVYYVDGHRKAVYSDALIPRGLVGRYGKVLGCRALILLHDEEGHPLLVTTHRGDTHLTTALPHLVERYERAAGQDHVRRMVIDREGVAAGFLDGLAKNGCDVVTVLRSNQYEGIDSFKNIGAFVPLSRDRQGNPTREVAPARYSLPLPDHPDRCLDLRVALVRDLRRLVSGTERKDDHAPIHDNCLDGPSLLDGGWVATPLPPRPSEAVLVPIVATATDFDCEVLAKAYIHRWSAQENIIRDWLLPLGVDTNHGYEKKLVTNSEAEKKRAALKKRLVNIRRWAEKARLASLRAQRTSNRRWKRAKARSREAYTKLNHRLFAMEAQNVPEREYRARRKELEDAVKSEMEAYWQIYYRAHDTCNREYAKWEHYCKEQRKILRKLEDLNAGERQMYELDNQKDQVMTILKLALANLTMWVRDNYFPTEYAHATWQRLLPFLRLPGWVAWGGEAMEVELRGFNDRRLNRDLTAVSALVALRQLRLPDGHRVVVRTQHPIGPAHNGRPLAA